jgi:hypothetical protein
MVLNYKTAHVIPPGAVNIMRGTRFGNPYRVFGRTREQAIAKFEVYARERVATDPEFRKAVRNLHGRTLLCCCAPLACHGGVLSRLADELVVRRG